MAAVFGDAPLDDGTIASLLREHWRLTPAEVRYERIGYGGYHWLAAAGGQRWLVTADAVDGPRPVVPCYELAKRLGDDGLEVVRPPLASGAGAVAVAAAGWWISVWPWLEGRSSTGGRHESAADLAAVAGAVRRLHDHPAGAIDDGLHDEWAILGWERFETGLPAAAASGPYAAEVRGLLAEHLGYVRDRKARYDVLAARRPPVTEWVVTHGEPHAANVVHTANGPVLIDWDTVRLAPRERDLWVLALYPGWQAGYGADADPELLEAYGLRWDLGEIAVFVPDLLAAQATTADLDVAIEELRGYLAE